MTVREVAAEASVAIGTVQHWFRTKDDLIVAAFTAVVTGIRERVDAVELGDDVRGDLIGALTRLLPLDDRRRDKARVQLAFAMHAVSSGDRPRAVDQLRMVTLVVDGLLADRG